MTSPDELDDIDDIGVDDEEGGSEEIGPGPGTVDPDPGDEEGIGPGPG